MSSIEIKVKRIYAPADTQDGYRVLVDRLWPRGVSKAAARIDYWWKEAAPTPALRGWFNHEAPRWRVFKQRYFAELDANRDVVAAFVEEMGDRRVTFLYAAKNEDQNHALALKEYLDNLDSDE